MVMCRLIEGIGHPNLMKFIAPGFQAWMALYDGFDAVVGLAVLWVVGKSLMVFFTK